VRGLFAAGVYLASDVCATWLPSSCTAALEFNTLVSQIRDFLNLAFKPADPENRFALPATGLQVFSSGQHRRRFT
jgi:hypothetical protein